MVKHMKPYKEAAMVNLMDNSLGEAPPPKTKEEEKEQNENVELQPHWKSTIEINLVADATHYNSKGGIPAEVSKRMKINWETFLYEPIIYMSDFWLIKRDYVELNDTVEALNVTLNFKNFMTYYF